MHIWFMRSSEFMRKLITLLLIAIVSVSAINANDVSQLNGYTWMTFGHNIKTAIVTGMLISYGATYHLFDDLGATEEELERLHIWPTNTNAIIAIIDGYYTSTRNLNTTVLVIFHSVLYDLLNRDNHNRQTTPM